MKMEREEKEEEGEKRDYEIWSKREKRVKWKGEIKKGREGGTGGEKKKTRNEMKI